MYNNIQQREIFHLAFLRQFVRMVKPGIYALKGGVNLRFFFGSVRYSEDMDIDIGGIEVFKLKDLVMKLLASQTLLTFLRAYQIEKVVPPDLKSAKQTETVQRFKVHLITSAGEDLFTKIEFSRRGLESGVKTESVSDAVLGRYHLTPLIVSHYGIDLALKQKVYALAGRSQPQARDTFDLYSLSSQISKKDMDSVKSGFAATKLKTARENLYAITFENFKDTVCAYLSPDDCDYYSQKAMWENIQLKVAGILGL